MTRRLLLLLIGASILSAIGAPGASAQTRTITVSKNGTGSGTVVSTPAGINCGATCSFAFPFAQAVTLVATPAAGSRLAGWGGVCESWTGSSGCPLAGGSGGSVTVTFNRSLTLTVNVNGSGSAAITSDLVPPDPNSINCGVGNTCTRDYDQGTVVTLRPVTVTGTRFVGWSGGGCSGTGICQVTMDQAKTVTGTFAKTYVVTITTGGIPGSGSGRTTSSPAGIDCAQTCNASFDVGTTVTLTMTPDAGSVVDGPCGNATTCPIVVDGDKTLVVKFRHVTRVTVTKTGSGTGTLTGSGIDCGATCETTVDSGRFTFTDGACESRCVTATPAAGSEFVGWKGGGCGDEPTRQCDLSLLDNTTVTAVFIVRFTLAVTKEGNGTGTVTSAPGGIDCGATCSTLYERGTTVTLTATPTAGSARFAGWSGGGCTGTGTCTLTLNASTAVVATFVATVTLTIERTGTGTVTSAPAGIDCGAVCTMTVDKGTTVTLTATPAGGTKFYGYNFPSFCPGQIENMYQLACTRTLDESQTGKALFAIPRTLTVLKAGTGTGNAGDGGQIDCGPRCSGEFPDGFPAMVVAVPDENSTFAGWTGCQFVDKTICYVTVNDATSVTATFTAKAGTATPTPTPTPDATASPTPQPSGSSTPPPATGTGNPRPATKIDTKLLKAKLDQRKRTVTFTFVNVGGTKRFECAFAKKGKSAKFTPCTSPKTYKKLKRGGYEFRVRTVGDTTPAVRTVKL